MAAIDVEISLKAGTEIKPNISWVSNIPNQKTKTIMILIPYISFIFSSETNVLEPGIMIKLNTWHSESNIKIKAESEYLTPTKVRTRLSEKSTIIITP